MSDEAELLALFRQKRQALEVPEGFLLEQLGHAGADFDVLARLEEPDGPLPGLMDPEPSFHIVIGQNQVGKTTLCVQIGMSWSAGEAPWQGAPELPGEDRSPRVLMLSAEQTSRRIYSVMARLSDAQVSETDIAYRYFHEWPRNLVLIGRDRPEHLELRPLHFAMQRLGEDGIDLLRAGLEAADPPFGLLVLDSLSMLKPPGVSESSSDEMIPYLDRLASLAADFGCYVLAPHHVGHANRSDARTAGRGSTAIGQVSQVQWKLARAGPYTRHLAVEGNAVLPRKLSFETAERGDPPEFIRRFQLRETLDDDDVPVRVDDPVLQFDGAEPFSQQDFAWKLRGEPPIPGKRPGGAYSERARRGIEASLSDGRIVRIGNGSGKQFQLVLDSP